jgi:excisionase family DNA binding protein
MDNEPDERTRSEGTTSLIDIQTVAERLGVQVRHVRRLVSERRIPFIKWGHLLRFDPQEVDRWIVAASVPPLERRP